jgi:hypothetical protein
MLDCITSDTHGGFDIVNTVTKERLANGKDPESAWAHAADKLWNCIGKFKESINLLRY